MRTLFEDANEMMNEGDVIPFRKKVEKKPVPCSHCGAAADQTVNGASVCKACWDKDPDEQHPDDEPPPRRGAM